MNISFNLSGSFEVYRSPFNEEFPCKETVFKLLYPILTFNHEEYDSAYNTEPKWTEFSFQTTFKNFKDREIRIIQFQILGFGFVYSKQIGY